MQEFILSGFYQVFNVKREFTGKLQVNEYPHFSGYINIKGLSERVSHQNIEGYFKDTEIEINDRFRKVKELNFICKTLGKTETNIYGEIYNRNMNSIEGKYKEGGWSRSDKLFSNFDELKNILEETRYDTPMASGEMVMQISEKTI